MSQSSTLKTLLRRFPPYRYVATQYHILRNLFVYPETADVKAHTGAYEAYWQAKFEARKGAMSPFRLARAQAMAELVQPGEKVLDLGVGDGAILKYLVDHRQIDGYGLDISAQAVEFCRSQGLNVAQADVNQPIGAMIDTHYDVIIMSEIIEHLPDPETVLNRLRDKSDRLMISIPNTGFYHHRLRLLMGHFPLQWVVWPGEHLRFWTIPDFRWWVKQLDFRLTHAIAYTGTPGLYKVWPGLFGKGMLYVLRDARPQN